MLRSPSAVEGQGGATTVEQKKASGSMLMLRDQMASLAIENGLKVTDALLPTPLAQDTSGAMKPEDRLEYGFRPALRDVGHLLPTVTTSESTGAGSHGTGADNLRTVVRDSLLPTPNTMDMLAPRSEEAQERQLRRGDPDGPMRSTTGNLREDVLKLDPTEQNWGKYEPAIRRWESVLGRPAPSPTLPDGKDGAHRLSSRFAEWMMGLPDGWITDAGVGRTAELKLAGNGVVPQQASLALTRLLSTSR